MKRKPHLHDGTVTMDLDKEDRVVEIPLASEPPVDGLISKHFKQYKNTCVCT